MAILKRFQLVVQLCCFFFPFVSLYRLGARRLLGKSTLKLTSHAESTLLVDDSIIEYVGPDALIDHMEAGCGIEDLGIQVMVGPSLIGEGRGLFISIMDDVEKALLPAGTPICGYSKGTFGSKPDGDKSVAYIFTDTSTGVIFQGKLMNLTDAISVAATQLNSNQEQCNVTDLVLGHRIGYDESKKEFFVEPDLDFANRYFVPFGEDTPEGSQWGPGRLGMFANDLAFFDDVTEEIYNSNTGELNILQIAWRMALQDGKLVPTWPVVITLRDLLFMNREPMEVGLQYSWRYWQNVMQLQGESGSGGSDSGSEDADRQ